MNLIVGIMFAATVYAGVFAARHPIIHFNETEDECEFS